MPPRLKAVSCRTIPIAPLRCRYNGWKALVPTLRQFSATTIRCTRQRRVMMMWLENQGANFREPLAGSTNYLGAYDNKFRLRRLANDSKEGEENGQNLEGSSANDHEGEKLPPEGSQDLTPFPLNKNFRSERVTSEALREAVWEKVMKEQQSVRTVSAELGVEMSRVGAIVRLKEIEKEWIRTGKPLAKPYAEAVMAMLPQTVYPPDPDSKAPKAHESINDLPVHSATVQQIFHPTSESRHFTRADAARIFDETLLPADERVPHPELALLERERLAFIPYQERVARAIQRNDELQKKKEAADQRRREWEAKTLKVVPGKRWDFRFRDISVDEAGADGRGPKGTGWRYGVPHMDRRKGEVKIPTRAI